MGCCVYLMKFFVITVNLAVSFLGITMLLYGVGMQMNIPNIEIKNYPLSPIPSIIVGVILFILSYPGWYGAVSNSNCFLVTHSITIIILMVITGSAAYLLYNYDKYLKDYIPLALMCVFNTDKPLFHTLESNLECCSLGKPSAYYNGTLPESCCPPSSSECVETIAFAPCTEVVPKFLETYSEIGTSYIIGVVVIQLLFMVFTLALASHALHTRIKDD